VNGDVDVDIAVVRSCMTAVCRSAGVPAVNHAAIVEHFLDGQLRGKRTHGVGKFCFESQFFAERAGHPWVETDAQALAIVNGNREVGPISAAFAVAEAVRRADEYGLGFVGLHNTQRYGILSTWSEAMAERGMVGLAMNTSTADSTVLGSGSPVLGVNAVSLAVPTPGPPFVVDLAMTVAPMGALWDARRGDAALPAGAFLDADGELTADCAASVAALIFGGHKGLALSMALQLLMGSHFGFAMGTEITAPQQTGYAFLAIKPLAAGGAAAFEQANARFIESVKAACAGTGAHVPGEQARSRREVALAAGRVRIARTIHERLLKLAAADVDARSRQPIIVQLQPNNGIRLMIGDSTLRVIRGVLSSDREIAIRAK
jgi:L-2-hydroxycarboxylate dehydrogenase (NAD+)